MNIDNLQDAPGVYAVQLPDGVVKFGQSKTVKSRVRTHLRTLRSYGVPVLDVAAVYVTHCEDAEKDLFARLTAAGYQRSSNSRESYIIPWDVATGMLDNPLRAAAARVPVGWSGKGIRVTGPADDIPGRLRCANPACRWHYTHVERVMWFFPGSKHPFTVTSLTPAQQNVIMLLAKSRPSEDDVVGVAYSCEECPALSAVYFSQHKGDTNVTTHVIGINRIDQEWSAA